MSFELTDQHVTDFHHHGYTILREAIPTSLLGELRVAGERVQEITYRLRGTKIARSTSVELMADELGPAGVKPFQDYLELPELLAAVRTVLTPRHTLGELSNLVLFTNSDRPSCQDWHRDIDENYAGIDNEEFRPLKADPTFFTQINCALYTDSCLWFVPGSAGRQNTAGELRAAGKPNNGIEGRGQWPDWENRNPEDAERVCLEYCRGMPGAVNVILESGDLALYRPLAWHTGNYAPHRRRMTLHHHPRTAEADAWYERWGIRMSQKQQPAQMITPQRT